MAIHRSAQVHEGAIVGEGATVGEGAIVGERATVGERAIVEGNVVVVGPLGSRNAYLSAYRTTDGMTWFATGCFVAQEQEFLARVLAVHGTKFYGQQYRGAIAELKAVLGATHE